MKKKYSQKSYFNVFIKSHRFLSKAINSIINHQSSIIKRKSQSGFTLIGAVIIIVLIGIALPGILISFNVATQELAMNENMALATMLAQDLMEEIKSKKWDENTPATGGSISAGQKTWPLGPETGEARGSGANNFNDIDDYNGLDNNPPVDASGNAMSEYARFTRQVEVVYVTYTDLDTAYTATPRPDYKRIKVTVSWNSGTSSVELITIMSNF